MRATDDQPQRPPRRWRRGTLAAALAAALAVPGVAAATSARAPDEAAPLSLVVQQVVQGDLVVAGAANRFADVDADVDVLCVRRAIGRAECDDNSSSASLDLPAGAAVVAARLYVTSSLAPSAGPLVARLAGPGDGGTYAELGPAVREAAAGGHRQAIWDVTELVRAHGGGEYTVSDIVSEPVGGLEHSSWAIVAAYDVGGVDVGALAAEDQVRFARRVISWHDGLITTTAAPVEVQLTGFTVPMDRPVFAKAVQLISGRSGGFDNVLFAGGPLGNNNTPGDAAPPAGVAVGTDPSCNSTVDVINGSRCQLGTALASAPSRTDLDVVRVPDRYLQPGATNAVLSVDGEDPVTVGVVALSIDQAVAP